MPFSVTTSPRTFPARKRGLAASSLPVSRGYDRVRKSAAGRKNRRLQTQDGFAARRFLPFKKYF